MDVAEYRKLNKPGWVLKHKRSDELYLADLRSTESYVRFVEQAQAFDDIGEMNRLCIILGKYGYDYNVIPIPDLPKKDNSGEIKKGLEKVVGDIVEYETVSLNHYGIASNLYNLIVRIVKEQTTDD